MGNCPQIGISSFNKKMLQMQITSEITLNYENKKKSDSSSTAATSKNIGSVVTSCSGDFDKMCENFCNAMNIALKEFILDDTLIENKKLTQTPQHKYKSNNLSKRKKNNRSHSKKNEKNIHSYGTFDNVNKFRRKKCEYTEIIKKSTNNNENKIHKKHKSHKNQRRHQFHKKEERNNLDESSIDTIKLNISNYSSEIVIC